MEGYFKKVNNKALEIDTLNKEIDITEALKDLKTPATQEKSDFEVLFGHPASATPLPIATLMENAAFAIVAELLAEIHDNAVTIAEFNKLTKFSLISESLLSPCLQSPREVEPPLLTAVKNGPLAVSLGLTIPPGPTPDITLPPVPAHLEEEKKGEVAQSESDCESFVLLGAFGKYNPSVPGSQMSFIEKKALPTTETGPRKRSQKTAAKQIISAINKKKLKEIEYKPVDNIQIFAKLTEEDFLFDGDHDDLVYKSATKYDYIDKRRLTAEKVFKISQGIIDQQSTTKFLGKNLDKRFLLLRNSVAFQGNE
jgi:hypothetical protein